VRDDPDFARRQRRIRLDPVDERGATRRGGEHLLQRNNARALARDQLERPQCIRVGERNGLSEVAAALERWKVFGRGYEDRGRHSTSV
jgi:hypothetical protein